MGRVQTTQQTSITFLYPYNRLHHLLLGSCTYSTHVSMTYTNVCIYTFSPVLYYVALGGRVSVSRDEGLSAITLTPVASLPWGWVGRRLWYAALVRIGEEG